MWPSPYRFGSRVSSPARLPFATDITRSVPINAFLDAALRSMRNHGWEQIEL
jgi:hypothetical protein